MSPDDHKALDELGQRLNALKSETSAGDTRKEGSSAMSQAMQMSSDFIAGIGVGTALGYFVDRWLDTSPIFLMLGVALGLAAGYRNLIRSIKPDVAGENQGPETPDDKDDDD